MINCTVALLPLIPIYISSSSSIAPGFHDYGVIQRKYRFSDDWSWYIINCFLDFDCASLDLFQETYHSISRKLAEQTPRCHHLVHLSNCAPDVRTDVVL
ncbi:uncharacterized protein HD556DRAFT_1358859 [Suillus plorans]|uniref:Secreted protein n=1 Tax=Suillus plorans TaxID=116603 RepID=A0A9P7DJI4_9AGAM|nr:uncharacterized protein HD556DRAFT_1358859 [Suillus plorans]KAG1796620.1 hypothetical protein HD556DRAFT_1358859 [Suillus plorans]